VYKLSIKYGTFEVLLGDTLSFQGQDSSILGYAANLAAASDPYLSEDMCTDIY